MGFAIPIDRWIKDKKFQRKISEIFYESDEKRNDKKKLIEKWEKFKKYKSITPQYIWMYTVAGMWLQNLKQTFDGFSNMIDLIKIKRVSEIYLKFKNKFLHKICYY